MEKTFHFKPAYLKKQDAEKNIVAGIPFVRTQHLLTRNKLSVVPGAPHCNPLVDSQKDYDQLITHLHHFKDTHRLQSIELRTSRDFTFDSEKFGSRVNGFSTYVLDLDKDINDIHKSFHRTCVRKAIKKAFKNDLELHIGHGEKELEIFYNFYMIMRKNNGLLPQPYRFFANMCKELAPKGILDIYICRRNGKNASAMILLKFKNKVICEISATLPEMYQYQTSPFLFWHAISNAHRQGYKQFDFGRTSDDHHSLSAFKSRWGTRRVPLRYYYIPEINGMAQMRNQSTLKRLMEHTVQNAPMFFNRFLGNMLYRYLM
ncbi:MAG: GNAT family N-acetyltransferase [Thermodesulfobacteriota bacterium]